MSFISKSFAIVFILGSLGLVRSFAIPHRQPFPFEPKPQGKTEWELRPSFKLDVICFLNTLTGDPFYLDYYKDEYAKFEPGLTPRVRTALSDLKKKIKDDGGGIISATLAINFSATDDQTLDDMLRSVKDSRAMQDKLRKTPYYGDDNWRLYESVRPDLMEIFRHLKYAKFKEYWNANILPKVNKRINEIKAELARYDIVSEVESHLGFSLSSKRITVYVLYYTQPHGIKVIGMKFLTDQEWPIKIVARNAAHEMMHPPFVDLKHDGELSDAINSLKQDDFIMDKVANHDKSFGYNSFEGLIEEDVVQAIEQLINEKFKIEIEARDRWKESDNGIHVFAVALYSLMKEEKFPKDHETFRGFLLRMIKTGRLSPGRIKPLYDAFYLTAAND